MLKLREMAEEDQDDTINIPGRRIGLLVMESFSLWASTRSGARPWIYPYVAYESTYAVPAYCPSHTVKLQASFAITELHNSPLPTPRPFPGTAVSTSAFCLSKFFVLALRQSDYHICLARPKSESTHSGIWTEGADCVREWGRGIPHCLRWSVSQSISSHGQWLQRV